MEDQNLDEIEEELKEEVKSKKKPHKVSGRSVFELQKIISKASENAKQKETHNSSQSFIKEKNEERTIKEENGCSD